MRAHRVAAGAAIALAIWAGAACASQGGLGGGAGGAERWTASLSPRTPDAGTSVTGTARLTARATPGEFLAAVDIFNGRPGATYPWHVHRGQCGDDRGIVGAADAYPPITIGQDGRGSAVATVRAALPPEASLFVNIHHSPTNARTIVSCGALTR